MTPNRLNWVSNFFWNSNNWLVSQTLIKCRERVFDIIWWNTLVNTVWAWALVIWIWTSLVASSVLEKRTKSSIYNIPRVAWVMSQEHRFPIQFVDFEWNELPHFLKKIDSHFVLDLEMFKKVTKFWIGPVEFVKEKYWKQYSWSDIKWRLVSQNWVILDNPVNFKVNLHYIFAQSTEQAQLISEAIKSKLAKWETFNFKDSWEVVQPKNSTIKAEVSPVSAQTTNNTHRRVVHGKQTYWSSLIESIPIPSWLNDSVRAIFDKTKYRVDAHTLLKAIAKKESNSWANMIAYLTKAKQATTRSEQITYINYAIWSILWKSNDASIFQITPWFSPLKDISWNVIQSRDELKKYLFWVFLHYVNPELFKETLVKAKQAKANNQEQLNRVSNIVDEYARNKSKSTLDINDIFAILAKIDKRFDNDEMWKMVVKFFIKEYKAVSESNPSLPHLSKVKLAINSYNMWTNATIDWAYAVSVLSNIPTQTAKNTQIKEIPNSSIDTRIPEIWTDIKWEYRAPVTLTSFPQERWKHLTLCSRTARKNLENLVPQNDWVLSWNAKTIVWSLLKKTSLLSAKDLLSKIQASEHNVFDVYIKNKYWHRLVIVKIWDELQVLDPYYTWTNSSIPVSEYKPFLEKWSNFVLWPSYKWEFSEKVTPKFTNASETKVLSWLSKKDSRQLSQNVSAWTNSILTSPKIAAKIWNSTLATGIQAKLAETPIEQQIAHYRSVSDNSGTLNKLHSIAYRAKLEQLQIIEQKLDLVNTNLAKYSSSDIRDEILQMHIKKLKDARYTLEKQIELLNAQLADIKWGENQDYSKAA